MNYSRILMRKINKENTPDLGARPSPMSSPEAIRRRRSAGALAQQQQQQGLVVGVSPLAQEGGGSKTPPSGSSPPREGSEGQTGKPPVYPQGGGGGSGASSTAGDIGMSPWVQRRLQAAEGGVVTEAGAAEGATSGTASPGRSNSPAVLR